MVMERYQRLYSIGENLYQANSDILLCAGVLLLDTKSNKVLAQLKFRNLSDKIVKGFQISLNCFDIGDKELEGVDEFQYLDLNCGQGMEFGSKTPIYVESPNTRSFKINSCTVYFKDGSKTTIEGTWEKLPKQLAISSNNDLLKQYQIEFGAKASFRFWNTEDAWSCSCGAINKNEYGICYNCKNTKSRLLEVDESVINNNLEKRIQKEKELARKKELEIREKEKIRVQKEKEKREKTKNVIIKSVFSCVTVLLLAIGIYVSTQVVYPNMQYKKAVEYYNSQKYTEALEIFGKIVGKKSDAKSYITKTKYEIAKNYFNDGNYEKAITSFEELNGFEDSKEYIEKSEEGIKENEKAEKYKEATELISSGEYDEALKTLKYIIGYKDTDSLKKDCVEKYSNELLADKNYEECIKICREEHVYNGAYHKSCYYSGISLQDKKHYKDAVGMFSNADNYKDSEKRRKQCQAYIDYDKAIEYMESGDLSKAIDIFSKNKDLKDATTYLNLCNNYVKYAGKWVCRTYYIYHDDGSVSDLNYTADDEDIEVDVCISRNKKVTYRVEGAKAKINGNVLTYTKYYKGSDISTFNLATGARVTQFLHSDGSKSDRYVYTHVKK